jgi:hypothetical protein
MMAHGGWSGSSACCAFLFSGLGLGVGGGLATLLVPEQYARPTLELSVASSLSLATLAWAQTPEPGLPAYGEYAAASGYALTTALIGLDAAWSSPRAMLHAPAAATQRDVPERALSPWLVYSPAVLGGLVSASRAFAPKLDAENRELAAGLALLELTPATMGLLLGVLDSRRREREPYEPWLAGGPFGSLGMSAGGRF